MITRQAELLKKLLKMKRMSQADLARALRLSPSHLCKVMKGERKLSPEKVLEVSGMLGVPMETFFQ